MRALHQSLDDDPKILVDPIAPRLIEPDGDFYKGALARLERERHVLTALEREFVQDEIVPDIWRARAPEAGVLAR